MPPYYHDNLGPSLHPPPGRRLPPNPSPAPSSLDDRSYSLTHRRIPHALAVQRSAGSLRSQAILPRMNHQRRPQMYPPRMHGPGYRSVSPALSDYNASPAPVPRRYIPRPPMAQYPSEYAYVPQQPMLAPRYPPMSPIHPHYAPPGPALQHYEQQHYIPPPHPQHVPVNPRHGIMFIPPHRQGLHPHHAMSARGYINRMDGTPPSSGPSSSAPHSSNPSTPHDNDLGTRAVEADFVEHNMHGSLDEDGEQAIYSSYIAYANKGKDTPEPDDDVVYEQEAHAIEEIHELEASIMQVSPQLSLAALPPLPASRQTSIASMPQPTGFVQRIKDLLENKVDIATQKPLSPRPIKQVQSLPTSPERGTLTTTSPIEAVLEDATHHTNREEVRLTRDLVKAFMSPSSSEHDMSTADMTREKRTSLCDPILEIANPERTSDGYPSDLIPDPETADNNIPWHSSHGSVSGESLSVGVEISIKKNNAAASDHAIDNITHASSGKDPVEAEVAVAEVSLLDEVRSIEVAQDDVVSEVVSIHEHPLDKAREIVLDMKELFSPHTDTSPHTPSKEVSPITPQRDSRFSRVIGLKDVDPEEFHDGDALVTSDIVTDIAVRFSIPRHASMAKANVVRVSSISDKSARRSKLHKDIHELPESITPRSSVPGAEYVAPLQVNKLGKQTQDTPAFTDGADLSSFIRRTFPRRQSAYLREKSSSDHVNTDTTQNVTTKPVELHGLPYVKEESSEDIPSGKVRHRSSVIGTVPEQQALDEDAKGLRSELTLSEIRNLPSLNFSNMDLADQLNAALGNRDSLPINFFETRVSADIASPSPIRPSSTESLRERYTSFFTKPEDFKISSAVNDSESISVESLMATRKDEDQRRVVLDTFSGSADAPFATKKQKVGDNAGRPLSPVELLGVAKEASSLSIPSVEGLSERLSELLPSLRRLHMNSVIASDEAVSHTLDEIHHLGERPKTTMSMRSSGVLRSLAAIADDIATHGTYSSQGLLRGPRINKSLPPLPKVQDTSSAEVTENMAEAKTEASEEISGSDDTARPCVRRTQSESNNKTIDPLGMSMLTPRRSCTINHSNSRPWNFDENYPWSSETGLISPTDGSVVKHERESIASHLLRNTANAVTSSVSPTSPNNDAMKTAKPKAEDGETSTSSMSDLEPTATVTADTLTNKHHTRTISKRAGSLLGSLSRRALKSPPRPSKDSTKRPGTSLSGTVLSSRGRIKQNGKSKRNASEDGGRSDKATPGSAAHAVSDRYPLTSLQPPAGYELDEVRSYFSSDAESATEGRAVSRMRRGGTGKSSQLRKRLSAGLRFNKSPTLRPASGMTGTRDHDLDEAGADVDATMMTGGRGSRSLDFSRAGTVLGSRRGRRISSGFWHSNGDTARGINTAAVESASALGFGRDSSDDENIRGGEGAPTTTTAGGASVHKPIGFYGRQSAGGGLGRVEFTVKRVGVRIRMVIAKGGKLLRKMSGIGRRERLRRDREWVDRSASLYSGT